MLCDQKLMYQMQPDDPGAAMHGGSYSNCVERLSAFNDLRKFGPRRGKLDNDEDKPNQTLMSIGQQNLRV